MKQLISSIIALAALCGVSTGALAQDVKAGEKKAAMCIGCHAIPSYQSSFPEVHKVPMISGQGAKYIVASLAAYQKGDRKHPTMRGIAASLTEQDMADLAAFYEQQPQATHNVTATPDKVAVPSAKVAELLTKGNCISCHGENFSKPSDGSYPKIAGQHADYLFVALKSYKTTNNPSIGRTNPVMAGMVQQFSNSELKELSKYLGSLPSELHTVAQPRFR